MLLLSASTRVTNKAAYSNGCESAHRLTLLAELLGEPFVNLEIGGGDGGSSAKENLFEIRGGDGGRKHSSGVAEPSELFEGGFPRPGFAR